MNTNLSIFIRAKRVGETEGQLTAVINGLDYEHCGCCGDSDYWWVPPLDAYETHEWKCPNNSSGLAWTDNDIANITAGVEQMYSDPVVEQEIRVTQIYIGVTYSESAVNVHSLPWVGRFNLIHVMPA